MIIICIILLDLIHSPSLLLFLPLSLPQSLSHTLYNVHVHCTLLYFCFSLFFFGVGGNLSGQRVRICSVQQHLSWITGTVMSHNLQTRVRIGEGERGGERGGRERGREREGGEERGRGEWREREMWKGEATE